jgi:hypothetical protein
VTGSPAAQLVQCFGGVHDAERGVGSSTGSPAETTGRIALSRWVIASTWNRGPARVGGDIAVVFTQRALRAGLLRIDVALDHQLRVGGYL